MAARLQGATTARQAGARAAILRVKIVFVTRCVVSCGTAAGSGAGLAALAVSLPAPYA
jgi:hypothetical protein